MLFSILYHGTYYLEAKYLYFTNVTIKTSTAHGYHYRFSTTIIISWLWKTKKV